MKNFINLRYFMNKIIQKFLKVGNQEIQNTIFFQGKDKNLWKTC